MRTCHQCQAEVTDDAVVCRECGAAFETGTDGSGLQIRDADYDPDEERELFEQRYGIDIGDRTVDEYLHHLAQQDYSMTVWLALIAVAQLAGIALFVLDVFAGLGVGPNQLLAFALISVVLAVGVFADTRSVGLFDRWAKIRWTYVLISALPLVGHIAAFFYLLLRRLMHEQTAEYRRRLLDAGFDVPVDAGSD